MDLVDERLGENFKKEEVMVMINVALICTQVSPTQRPTMVSVVSMLEGKTVVREVVSDTYQQFHQQREHNKNHETQEESISIDEIGAFMSDTDLNSLNMDSSGGDL